MGGGSTLLTLLRDGEIVTSQGLRLGSVRLHEVLADNEDLPEQTAEVLRYQVTTMLAVAANSLPLDNVESFIAVGGDARFAVRQIGRPCDTQGLFHIDPGEFDTLVARCEHWTSEELAKRFGVPFAEAETINPALLVYQNLFRLTKAPQIIVSSATMRDGLLLELANRVTGKEDRALAAGVIHSATAIARNTTLTWGTPKRWPTWPCGCSTRSRPSTAWDRGTGCCCTWRPCCTRWAVT